MYVYVYVKINENFGIGKKVRLLKTKQFKFILDSTILELIS